MSRIQQAARVFLVSLSSETRDRKSTRLNSSHDQISYAVFCLKKKNNQFGPSKELFATEDGTIAGWNSTVDPTHAVITVDNSASVAAYEGLALGGPSSCTFLSA